MDCTIELTESELWILFESVENLRDCKGLAKRLKSEIDTIEREREEERQYELDCAEIERNSQPGAWLRRQPTELDEIDKRLGV